MRNRTRCCTQIIAVLVFAFAPNVVGQSSGNFVQKALEDSSFTWRSSSTDKVRIFYQTDSFADRHRMMLLRSAGKTVEEVLELLEEPTNDTVLNVFYLESRDEMNRIVGRPYSGFANWGANAIFVVVNPEWRSFEKHEFAHVVTMGTWGPPDVTSRWMIEGMAIYCDGWCREYTVEDIAFHLQADGQLPPLREFFDDFAGLGEIRAGFYAASFIGFVRRTFGVDMVRSLWLNGVGNIETMLGNKIEQIENSWKLYIKNHASEDIQVDIETINELGCG